MADCLRGTPATPEPPQPDPEPSPSEELGTTGRACNCPRCRSGSTAFEALEFEFQEAMGQPEQNVYEADRESAFEAQGAWAGEGTGPFSEAEEIALAAELLSVSSEAELEQFLGKLFNGIKKVGSFIG
jgi:hypothetical protein